MAFDAGSIKGRMVLSLGGWKRSIRTVRKDADRVKARLREIGKESVRLSRTLGVAGIAITGFFANAVKAAAGVEESENLFTVAMGKMAESTRKWSEETSDALGLNRFALRESVASFNALFVTLGIGEKTAASMSKTFALLAVDLASFFNKNVAQTQLALQAGLVGEAEPLKRLNVLIRESIVQAKALEMGLAAQGQVLTEQQKVAARYALVLEQTSLAQGDLARTMMSTTNVARRLFERIKEGNIELGQILLPNVTRFLTLADEWIVRLRNLAKGNQDTTRQLIMLAAGAGVAALALGALGFVLPAMITGFSLLLGPVGILPVAAALALFVTQTNSGRIAFEALTISVNRGSILALEGLLAFASGTLEAARAVSLLGRSLTGLKGLLGAAAADLLRLRLRSGMGKMAGGLMSDLITALQGGAQGIGSAIFDAIDESLKEGQRTLESINPFRILIAKLRENAQEAKIEILEIMSGAFAGAEGAAGIETDIEAALSKLLTAFDRELNFDEITTGMKGAGDAMRRLREEGENLMRVLYPARDLFLLAQEGIEQLKAAGKIDPLGLTASLFGEKLWEDFQDLSSTAINSAVKDISKLGTVGTQVGVAIVRAMKDSAQAIDEMGKKAKKAARVQEWRNLLDTLGRITDTLSTGMSKAFRIASIAVKLWAIATRIAMESSLGVIGLILEALYQIAVLLGFAAGESEKMATGMQAVFEGIADSIDEWADRMTDAIVEFVKTGKLSFKDFVDSVLEDMLRITLTETLTKPLIGGLVSALGGAFGAKGATPGGGELTMKALLPSRAPGGGTVVNIIDQRTAGEPPIDVKTSQQADGTQILEIVVPAMKAAFAGGFLDADLAMNFGLQRAPMGR